MVKYMVWKLFSKKLQGVIKKRGFGSPTDIQVKGIPPIHAGEDTLLLAPTGLGKCVSGDTLILTNRGPVEIRELYGEKIKVQTMTGNLKITQRNAFVIKKKRSVQYELKTATGRSVKVTSDHKFFTVEADGPIWKELKKLKLGDYIAIPRRLMTEHTNPELTLDMFDKCKKRITVLTSPSLTDIINRIKNSKEGIGTRKIASLLGFSRDVLLRAKRGYRIDIRIVRKLTKLAGIPLFSIRIEEVGIMRGKNIKLKIDEEFAYFAGLLLGDGNINQGRNIRFSTASDELLEKFKNFCKKVGLKVGKDKSHLYDYYATSETFVTILDSINFPVKNKSSDAIIPGIFFKSKKLLSSFLRGLYDTDGSFYGILEFLTKSKKLAQNVIFALSYFGIVGILKEKKVKGNTYYRVLIEKSEDFRKFKDAINFFEPNKRQKLSAALELSSNPNIDLIPSIRHLIKSCGKLMRVPYSREHMYRIFESYKGGRRNPSRKGLLRLLKYFKKFSKFFPKEYLLLEKLAKSEIYWDRIKAIKKAETDWVYDATVPETHNFIGNGIILHNTESVLLPIFDRFAEKEHKPISILYITPLRSLNRDLLKRILWWANRLGFDVSVRHGDTTQYERSMQAENPPDMLISTPETLQAVLTGKIMRRHLSNIRWIVTDEVHELVNNKRGVQLSIGLERLKELIKSHGNPEPQIIGLSATVGSPKSVALFLTAGKPCRIVNTMKKGGLNLIVESPKPGKKDFELSPEIFMEPSTTARLRRIEQLIKEKKSVLTFTNTRESAEILSSRLGVLDKDLPIETHHSSLSKEVRIRAEEGFKKGEIKSLVCTSSLELGIDIGLIDFILQYMSPRQVAKVLQRVGRSGHTTTGVSDGVIISSEPDDCFESTVVATLALDGRIEPTGVYKKALDVLGHQIVGLAIEEYKIPFNKTYSIIKRAWPYSELTRSEFLEVCRLMQRLGFIWLDTKDMGSDKPEDLLIKRRRRAWEYYFQNLSTIPDTKNYQIFDVISNQPVGTLDAEFIALHGDPGTSFICKGQAWKILELHGSKVMVEPIKGIEAAIPAWEGELIPVPFAVAQGVGMLRSQITRMLKGPHGSKARLLNQLVKNYPITRDVAGKLYSTVKKQAGWGPVPDDRNILMEHFGVEGETCVIIHACFGSLINETLGRVLSTILITKLGSVGLQTDPYRIMIKLQTREWRDVLDVFRKLDPETLEVVLKLTLPNTELFRWRFLHVAHRLGIISKDADFGTGYLKKIIESYRDTTPHREAMHEVFTEKLDLAGAREALKLIRSGKIGLKVRQGLSPIGELGLMRRYEVVAPKKPDKEIFNVFKKRLMDTKVRLICCQCGWAITYPVKNLPKDIHCAQCQAKLMGVIKPYEFDKEILLNKYVKKRALTKEEMEDVNSIMDTASLVVSSGRDATIVLAGRGIGPRAAKRILRRPGRGDELLKDILREEITYAKNKRFWRG